MNLQRPLRRLALASALAIMITTHSGRSLAAAPAPSALDRAAGEEARAWLAGRPAPASAAAPSAAPSTDPLADWRAYRAALAIPSATAREQALRAIYKRTRSAMLRGVILRAITENPEFQSRQALFIRRYGVYANWFNRLVYSANRVVQGNLQALAQLTVEGLNDAFGHSETDPTQRRAYDLMRRAQEQGARRSPEDQAEFAKLERAVLRALAQSDLDLAQYLLKAGDPEGASFYAAQAHELRPEWGKAESVRLKADADVARLRRDQIASTQVGYPDRPVTQASPELLRGILTGKTPRPETLPESERLVASAIRSLPPPTAGQATMTRPWREMLQHNPTPNDYSQRWLSAVATDPQTSIDQRLAEARATRRSGTLRYIFIGPERPREQVYKTATWFTTAWSALQNVGVFYVFEVMGRTGRAIWAPPVPAEEVIDAQAAWLRQAPDLKSKESRKIAESLYKAYLEQGRYDDARRVLTTTGQLDPGRADKINKAEAGGLLDTARALPAGAERQAVIERIQKLAPGSGAARKAAKIIEDEKKHAELRTLNLNWDAMTRWTGAKPPCGLPGEAAWFDGSLANGEAAPEGLTFEHRDGDADLTVRYPVNYPGEQRVFQVRHEFKRLPASIRQWFELSANQDTAARQTIKQLHRLPIPFAVEGDAGASGVDVYPKLLPIQSKPGEIELYR